MSPSSSPPPKPAPARRTSLSTVFGLVSDDPGHPVQVALRAHSLCLFLSLGPVLLPLIFTLVVDPKRFKSRASVFWRALSRELWPTGFASAITVAVGGGAALQRLWDSLERPPAWVRYTNAKLSQCQRAFLANVITSTLAATLLRWRGQRRLGRVSPTLDLSLLLLVRALDALVQASLLRKAREIAVRQIRALSHHDGLSRPSDAAFLDKQREDLAKEWQTKVATHLDALVFWASSARIMWCFFYQPQRLPASYVRWIGSLANIDKRLLEVLRALREGTWSYIHHGATSRDIVRPLAEELGRSPSWGDPIALPAYGGNLANETWQRLGVDGRSGVGGLPCELVHGGIGAKFGLHNSCVANATIRGMYAFAEALAIYLPVHLLPILLTKPSSIIHPHRALLALLSAMQSAVFLSSFLSSCWFGVCFTRTLVLARLFPKISHEVWDGPCGGTLVGSLVCGASIWIENAKRRREMALYVLPKALRASISEKLLRSRHPMVQFAECLTFVVSLASLLTLSVHRPESLRGLSRWTLSFVMKGASAGLWKKRRRDIVARPATPMESSVNPPSRSG